jgi:hypothetical protein
MANNLPGLNIAIVATVIPTPAANTQNSMVMYFIVYCRTMSARTVRERRVYEKEIGKFMHRCVARLVRNLPFCGSPVA